MLMSNKPTVPFVPESFDSLKARYPKALEKRFDVNDAPEIRPGADRTHIFDFEDGLRVIASVDFEGERVFLHFSCSITEDRARQWIDSMAAIVNVLPTPLLRIQRFLREVAKIAAARIYRLSGQELGKPEHISTGGVIHWFVPWK